MAGLKGRLLALSWTMPPLVFPRSLQISRLLRGLRARGWETTVVTIAPDAEPHATRDDRLAEFYRDAYPRILIEPREDVEPSSPWLRWLRRWRPPADIRLDNWVRRAGRAMRDEARTGEYGAMITFAQPWIDHLVGLDIKRDFPGLPWIAHFSDPWVDSAYREFADDAERKAAFDDEQRVIATADAVVFVNQHTADLVMAKYPASWREKVRVVPHATEPDLLDFVKPGPAVAGKMRIVHTGNFYGHRPPDLVLRAVAAMCAEPAVRRTLLVEFVGHADEALRQSVADMDVGDVVTFTGSRPYLESLEIARSADLLLLIDAPAETSVFLPSKLVDYLMLERPILGITPRQGASAEVLGSSGFAVVDPADADGILSALRAAHAGWAAGVPAATTTAAPSAFAVETIAADFEALLCSISPSLARAAALPGRAFFRSLDGISTMLDARESATPVTLILPSSDGTLCDALLSRPDVASIIFSAREAALEAKYPGRCGWWDLASGRIELPSRLGSEVHHLLPGQLWNFGFRSIARLWRRNVRRIVYHDPDLGMSRRDVRRQALASGLAAFRYRLGTTAIGRRVERAIPAPRIDATAKSLAQRAPALRPEPGRIMLVSGSLGPGGSERQVVNTLLGLKAAGHDVTLLHVNPLAPPHDFFMPVLAEAGIRCLDIGQEVLRETVVSELPGNLRAILNGTGQLGVPRDAVLGFLRVFREHRPEVVHTWLDEINIAAGLGAVLAGVPRVVLGCRSMAPHRFPFHQAYMRPMYRLLAAQPNVALLNNSAAGAADYADWAGLSMPIRVIRNGFHFPGAPIEPQLAREYLREQAGVGTSSLVVGTIMRLSAGKRPHLWLDFAEHVAKARQDTHFVVIGDGPMMNALGTRIQSSPIAGRVSLLGRRHDATRLLAGLDAFVLTSSVEGLPNVLVEAQSEGVAVVASDVGGVREIFADGDTGIVVDDDSADAFAGAVLRVLDDASLRQRAREQGPLLMRERFSAGRMVRETVDAYQVPARMEAERS